MRPKGEEPFGSFLYIYIVNETDALLAMACVERTAQFFQRVLFDAADI